MEQDTDWMRGFIIREQIPKDAVTVQGEGDEKVTFLHWFLTKMKAPDKKGNTHTVYCQSYNKETKERGEKHYIGKARPAGQAVAKIAPEDSFATEEPTVDMPF